VSLVVLALLGLLCMIYAGRMLVREYSVR